MSKVAWLALGVVLLVWFLDAISLVLLAFVTAIVIALALNAPVTWLEQRRLPRVVGTALVTVAILLVVAGLSWLVMPRLLAQLSELADALPAYMEELSARLASLLSPFPSVADSVREWDASQLTEQLPSLTPFLLRAGRYTLSLIAGFVLFVSILFMALYMVVRPRTLLRTLVLITPPSRREDTERAFVKSSGMVVGWIWANIVVGTVEAAFVLGFLLLLGVPGAIVWAALAFFAELVPKLGPYLMAIPPILVALAVDPLDAVWLVIFYAALNELTSDFLAPYVRGRTMEIHPMILLLAVLVMAAAFGLFGALIATPVVGLVTAILHEFYLKDRPPDDDLDDRVERMLAGRLREE